MKPAPFAWHGPESVDEATAVLAEYGDHAKVLAGGQSLIPVLAMRLAEPAHIVDINRVAELDLLSTSVAGVTVGALARHSRVEHDADAARVQPLLAQALRLVAHPTIRNRGTTVGSLAHADPAGEMTAVLALCGGNVTAVSVRGRRVIDAADFFRGPLESALRPDELAEQAFFPALPIGAGTAFVEIARRHGDYALCGVGVIAELNDAGPCTSSAARTCRSRIHRWCSTSPAPGCRTSRTLRSRLARPSNRNRTCMPRPTIDVTWPVC